MHIKGLPTVKRVAKMNKIKACNFKTLQKFEYLNLKKPLCVDLSLLGIYERMVKKT